MTPPGPIDAVASSVCDLVSRSAGALAHLEHRHEQEGTDRDGQSGGQLGADGDASGHGAVPRGDQVTGLWPRWAVAVRRRSGDAHVRRQAGHGADVVGEADGPPQDVGVVGEQHHGAPLGRQDELVEQLVRCSSGWPEIGSSSTAGRSPAPQRARARPGRGPRRRRRRWARRSGGRRARPGSRRCRGGPARGPRSPRPGPPRRARPRRPASPAAAAARPAGRRQPGAAGPGAAPRRYAAAGARRRTARRWPARRWPRRR